MKYSQIAGFNNWYKKNKLNEQEDDFSIPSDEEIDKYKDFDGLMQKYNSSIDDVDDSSDKVYILSLMVDMSGGPGAMIESIIKVSMNREELESYMDSLPEIEYDEEDQEYDGMSVSDAPYYDISEHRLND